MAITLACICAPPIDLPTDQLATSEAHAEEFEEFVAPASNLAIKPGAKKGQAFIKWEHSKGNELTYYIYFHDEPITDDNWQDVDRLTMEKRKITSSKENDAVTMVYEWNDIPQNKKQYVVVRQTLSWIERLGKTINFLEPIFDFEIPKEDWMIPPSVFPPSNMVSYIDSGFHPNPDGYKRENDFPSDFDPMVLRTDYIDMMWLLYGAPQVCEKVINGICLPKNKSREIFKEFYFGGQCNGFSVSAGLIFINKLQINDFAESSLQNKTINLGNTREVNELLMVYQLLQIQPEIQKQRHQRENLNSEEFMNHLEQLLIDRDDLPNLGLRYEKTETPCTEENKCQEENKCVGHSIVPYFLVSNSELQKKSWVYDSNAPKYNSQIISFNPKENTWDYFFDENTTRHGSYGIDNEGCKPAVVEEISLYEDYKKGHYINKAPWAQLTTKQFVLVNGDTRISIANPLGSIIGFDNNGNYINTLNNALHDVLNEEGLQLFKLPKDEYDFMVFRGGDAEQGVLILSSDVSFILKTLTEGDHFAFSNNSVTYQNQQNQTNAQISVVVEKESQSALLQVQPELLTGQTFSMNYDPESLSTNILSDDPTVYSFEIEIINNEGEYFFSHDEIPYNQGEIVTIEPEEILLEDEIFNIELDVNADGNVDEIITLENEFQLEEEPYQQEQESEPLEDKTHKQEQELPGWLGIMITAGASLTFIILIIIIARKRKKAKENKSSDDYFGF